MVWRVSDVDETPFELRSVTIRRDRYFTDEFDIVDFLGRCTGAIRFLADWLSPILTVVMFWDASSAIKSSTAALFQCFFYFDVYRNSC